MAVLDIPLDQGSAFLKGVSEINQLSKQNLDNTYQSLINKYYGPNIESEMAYRQANTNKLNVMTPLEAENQRNINEWYAKLKKAELEASQIKTAQDTLKNNLIRQVLNLQNNKNQLGQGPSQLPSMTTPPPSPMPPSTQSAPPGMQTPPIMPPTDVTQQGPQPSRVEPQLQPVQSSPNQLNYSQAALLTHMLGLRDPQIIDVNGKKIAVTPFGNIPIAEGLTPSQESYQKQKGKYAGTAYGENVETYKGLQNQDVALNEMINLIDNPDFRKVSGPVKSHLANWFGTSEQKKLLGSLQSSSGEIALQVAPSLKGAFTGRDQTLINTIKANPNTDFPDVFIGKLKAQKLINSVLMERSKLAAKYIDQGMSPLDAYDRATKETPLNKFRPIVQELIEHKLKVRSPGGRVASGSKKNIDKFLKDHPDWKLVNE